MTTLTKLDEDRIGFEIWTKEIEKSQTETSCECHPQMRNAGTNGVEFFLESEGCPLHCIHKGINTLAGEWYCSCGACWSDK